MNTQFKRNNRRFHFWAALVVCLPILVVIISGLLLQVKKEVAWIQPPTQKGASNTPSLPLERLLSLAQDIPELEVSQWQDIDRLDIRPGKGVIKLKANNHWEAQFDASSGQLLQLAYRRSDVIESLHDGSFFNARLSLFLPAAIILFFIWLSGIYMLMSQLKLKLRRYSKPLRNQ